MRRLHLAALADDGRDLGQRHPRALTRTAARRQRSRLVLGAAGRRRAEGARGRGRDPGACDGARAARLERADTARDERCGARLRSQRDHDLGRVAENYAAALEEAAGGTRVADAVVAEVAQAAAEIGIEPGTPFAAELAGRLDDVGLARNGRPEPAPPPKRSRLARVPVWAWLAGLVVLSAVFRYGLSRRVVAPWIMVDELIYSELAKSFAQTGHFLIRDVHAGAYGVVYPLLIAPAWRVFGSVPDAYAAAKTIGSVLMSLTAIPVYFLARRVLMPIPSLFAALLAVAVPSLMYTGTLMTETVFYPLFACVALALVLALERPTIQRQLVLLGLCVLAFLTRSQAIVLIPAVATAPLLLAWLDRRRLRMLADFRVLYGVLAAGVVGVLAVQLARGHSPYDVLGSYSVTGHATYRPDQVLKWVLYHVAELDLYLGIVPFAALVLLTFVGRSLDRPLRVFLAAALPLTAWLLLEVGAFASALSPRIQERNLFYVAPLFLIALLAWIERGMPRPPRAAAIAAVLAAALPGALPYHRLIDVPAESDTLALATALVAPGDGRRGGHDPGRGRRGGRGDRPALLLHLAALRARATGGRAALVRVRDGTNRALRPRLPEGIGRCALPGHHRAEARLGRCCGRTERRRCLRLLRQGSRRITRTRCGRTSSTTAASGPVYDLRQPSMGGLPETHVTQRADGVLLADGKPVRHAYVLSEEGVPLAGAVVARDELKGMALRRTDGLVRIGYRVQGLYPNDTWSGKRVTYTRLRCAGGAVTAQMSRDPNLVSGPQTVRADGRSVTFGSNDDASLTVPLHPRGGVCRAVFTVTPTAVPGPADPRVLGVHFLEFRYAAP